MSTGGPAVLRPPVLVYQTDLDQVAGGGNVGGWVTGTPAGLADGASDHATFDLGPSWDQYRLVQVSVLSRAALELSACTVGSSDTSSYSGLRWVKDAFQVGAATLSFTVATSYGIGLQVFVRPMGRYLHVSFTNTAGYGAQGVTSKVSIACYP